MKHGTKKSLLNEKNNIYELLQVIAMTHNASGTELFIDNVKYLQFFSIYMRPPVYLYKLEKLEISNSNRVQNL